MHIRNTPGCLVMSKDYDKTRDFRMVALGRKYDTEIFLSATKETRFLYLYTCYLDEDYVPRYARNFVLYIIYHLTFTCIDLYDLSAWDGCWFVVYIYKEVYLKKI